MSRKRRAKKRFSLRSKIIKICQDKRLVLCAMLASCMMLLTGFAGDAHEIHINVDGRTIKTQATTVSPERILSRAGIKLNANDEYQLKTKNENLTEINVYRAVPVTVEYQGVKKEVLTSKPTVGDLVSDLGYDSEAFEAIPGAATKIQENLDITIVDRVPERPREEQIGEFVETSRGARRYSSALVMEASAYLPSDGGGSGVTASGMIAQRGVAAVDPDVIPLGTQLYVEGYGLAIAADTGGAIVGEMIDLCMEDYGEAMDFGRRDVTVYVLD